MGDLKRLLITTEGTIADGLMIGFPGDFNLQKDEVAELIAVHYFTTIWNHVSNAIFSWQYGLAENEIVGALDLTVANFIFEERIFGRAMHAGEGQQLTAVGDIVTHANYPLIVPLYDKEVGQRIYFIVHNEWDSNTGAICEIFYRPKKVPLQQALTAHRRGT